MAAVRTPLPRALRPSPRCAAVLLVVAAVLGAVGAVAARVAVRPCTAAVHVRLARPPRAGPGAVSAALLLPHAAPPVLRTLPAGVACPDEDHAARLRAAVLRPPRGGVASPSGAAVPVGLRPHGGRRARVHLPVSAAAGVRAGGWPRVRAAGGGDGGRWRVGVVRARAGRVGVGRAEAPAGGLPPHRPRRAAALGGVGRR